LWSSGGTGHIGEGPKEKLSDLPKKEINVDGVPDDHESRILAARERFLARKGKK
jgi:ATP-dependent RNA helicase DHX8/PRP22